MVASLISTQKLWPQSVGPESPLGLNQAPRKQTDQRHPWHQLRGDMINWCNLSSLPGVALPHSPAGCQDTPSFMAAKDPSLGRCSMQEIQDLNIVALARWWLLDMDVPAARKPLRVHLNGMATASQLLQSRNNSGP